MPHIVFHLLCSLKCIMKKIIPTPNIPFPISSCTFTVLDLKNTKLNNLSTLLSIDAGIFGWIRFTWHIHGLKWLFILLFFIQRRTDTSVFFSFARVIIFQHKASLQSKRSICLHWEQKKISLPIYKNDNSCNFRFARTVTLASSDLQER